MIRKTGIAAALALGWTLGPYWDIAITPVFRPEREPGINFLELGLAYRF